MAIYQSDITKFLNQLQEKNPELEHLQKYGHNLLRDKPLDLKKIAEKNKSTIPQKPYVYGSDD